MALYMDNLVIHKMNEIKEIYNNEDIVPIYSPVYSPDYNPIEFFFSMLKNQVKRIRLKDMMKNKQRSYYEIIPEAMQNNKVNEINKCIQHVKNLLGIKN